MPYCRSNDVSIYYETLSPRDGVPIVFIEGLSAQLIGWRDAFVQRFADEGLRVVRLDNRDVGLSGRCGGAEGLNGCYGLSDMAGDVCAVLDDIGAQSAHIVGQSMGGMIAQQMILEHPARVRSATLFYTAPGVEGYAGEVVLARAALSGPPPVLARGEAIAAAVANQRDCGSTAYPFDEAEMTAHFTRSHDRGYAPAGVTRQFAAVRRGGDRLPALTGNPLPVAIVHGRADRLIRHQAAIDLARALPNAELHLFPGLGHEIATALWDDFARIILRTTARA